MRRFLFFLEKKKTHYIIRLSFILSIVHASKALKEYFGKEIKIYELKNK